MDTTVIRSMALADEEAGKHKQKLELDRINSDKISNTIISESWKSNQFQAEQLRNSLSQINTFFDELKNTFASSSSKSAKSMLVGLDMIVSSLTTLINDIPKISDTLERLHQDDLIGSRNVTDAIKSIKFPDIPETKIPEYPKQIKSDVVSLPKYVADGLGEIKKAISNLEVKPEVKVDVAPAEVNLDFGQIENLLQFVIDAVKELEVKPQVVIDLKSVKNAVNRVEQAINDLRFPISSSGTSFNKDSVGSAIITKPARNMKWLTAGALTYLAYAQPGQSDLSQPYWQVKKIDSSNGTITYADGNDLFDNVASNLPSLTYS